MCTLWRRAHWLSSDGEKRRDEYPRNIPYYAVGKRFASRTTTHDPFVCLRRIDNALPDRTAESPPEIGVIRTLRALQQYARLPETSISWISPVESMRCVVSISRSPFSNWPRPFIGALPATRKTTSSAIRRRTVSTSPAAVARCHSATRFRIACSSALMNPPF
jgi:hypothetical protein